MHDTRNLADETLAFTEEDINQFVQAFRIPLQCDCADGSFQVALNPDLKPALLSIPDPRDDEAANWFFWLTCICCGQTKMISAARVWTWMKDKDQDDQ